jgi:hypothetical protein
MPSPLQPFAFDGDFPFLGGNHITVARHAQKPIDRFSSQK